MPGWGCLLRDEQLKEPGYDLLQEFALFPPFILEEAIQFWVFWEAVHP